ncbi:MAG: histidine--tRNA ligase [Chloroflexota bacterium]
MLKAPRGTSDILPEEQHYWQFVERKAAALCQLYGYERIETPVFEDAALFSRSMGDGTDIVDKEMYLFKDRGNNALALRPEGTAPVCRAYLEHGMHNRPQPVKLYYLITAFRYERPQAGRYRQHHQFGFEAIGSDDPALDAEVMEMAWQFYGSMDMGELSLLINSIGCRQCRPDYVQALRGYYSGLSAQPCPDCQVRLKHNPLRLLDCKDQSCQSLAEGAPRSADHLCPACAAHFQAVQAYLDLLELSFQVNHRLVRGLDYYTRTVFEVQPAAEGAQSTLGGGGRYDGLIEELGGRPTPGIGFATGLERIILNLKQGTTPLPPPERPLVYIAAIGPEAKRQAVRLASRLRRSSLPALTIYGERSLKAQLKQVHSLGIPYAAIIGEEELKGGTVLLRDMVNSEQKPVPLESLPHHLRTLAPQA